MRAQKSATNLNHGTEEKPNKDHACRLEARIERISQNLTTLLDLSNTASRGIWTNNVSRRDGEPRPLAEAETPSNRAREKVDSKTSRDMGSETSRDTLAISTDSRAHGVFSTRKKKKRCCVCRDFTAARCNHKGTKCTWLGRVSETARVTLEMTKHGFPRKSLKDTC